VLGFGQSCGEMEHDRTKGEMQGKDTRLAGGLSPRETGIERNQSGGIPKARRASRLGPPGSGGLRKSSTGHRDSGFARKRFLNGYTPNLSCDAAGVIADHYPPHAHNKNQRLNPGLRRGGPDGPERSTLPPPGGLFSFSSLFRRETQVHPFYYQ
jgi:hypothetical protein